MVVADAPDFPGPDSGLVVGDIAYDTRARAVGVLMAEYGTLYFLRPLDGGREWDVPKGKVRLATVADRLFPAVAEVNAESLRRAGHRP
ncbi:hypothetical protein GCM10010232_58720 [Streptomyces amakusaensis]|uniref:Uncharacterized protein n=1 Tax=Streptomyces amakusaensis TaxID=67271 RepID=A0ABW0APS8_9ACTN